MPKMSSSPHHVQPLPRPLASSTEHLWGLAGDVKILHLCLNVQFWFVNERAIVNDVVFPVEEEVTLGI